jgi:prepilin-type N-terminal cleavage/methylation domain-containing protein
MTLRQPRANFCDDESGRRHPEGVLTTEGSSGEGTEPRIRGKILRCAQDDGCALHARQRGQPGFTLIEMMVAVIVMGVLTGMVVLSFAGPVNRARLVEAVEQVTYLDASARQFARRTGRAVEIRIDLGEGALERREGSRGVTFRTTVPATVRIEVVRTVLRRAESGEIVMPVSAQGVSLTYAVKLAGTQGARWIVVAGLSGEVRTLTDDAQVDSIFAAITGSRRDAD